MDLGWVEGLKGLLWYGRSAGFPTAFWPYLYAKRVEYFRPLTNPALYGCFGVGDNGRNRPSRP